MRTRLLAWLVVLAFACGKEETEKPSVRAPVLRFAEGTSLGAGGVAELDFGEVAIGRQARATVVVENLGGEPLTLQTTPPNAPFSIVDAPETIAPRSLASLVFRFAPEQEGQAVQTVVLRAGRDRLAVRLRGAGGPIQEDCIFHLEPPELRLSTGVGGPDLPWVLPVGIRVERGRCAFEGARAIGDFTVEVEGADNSVFLPGVEAGLRLRIGGIEVGRTGSIFVRMDGHEVELPVRVEESPLCVGTNVQRLELQADLHCDITGQLSFESSCGDLPRLGAARIWPPEEAPTFEILLADEKSLGIRYVADEPLRVEEAVGVFDFDNGDRVVVPLTGRAKMREVEVAIPPRKLDLLVLVDKHFGIVDWANRIDAFASDLWDFVVSSPWEVEVGVTSTVVGEDEPACPAENGQLIPLDASRPQLVRADTPDGQDVLRQNLTPLVCVEGAVSKGLEAVLAATPWSDRDGTRMAIAIVADHDNSAGAASGYPSAFASREIRRFYVIGPCPRSARYETVIDSLGGKYRPICVSDPHLEIFEAIDEYMGRPLVFELGWPAHTGGETYATEEKGIYVFVDDEPLPSHGGPVGWVVYNSAELRVDWGLPPGTKLRVVYPPWPSACDSNDG